MPIQSTWTSEDLATLMHKRNIERKPFEVIGTEMKRPRSSCSRVWWQHNVEPEIAAPSIVSDESQPLHRELGILTFVHRQAVTDYVGGFNRETGQYFSPHEYRARVTLPKVIA